MIDLHREDRWHGIHGKWEHDESIASLQCDPRQSEGWNVERIIDSVAYAFARASGRAADQ